MARILAVLMTLLLTILAVYAWIRLDVPIERVRVDGQLAEAERAQVRAAVDGNLSGGMLGADLDGLKAAIEALSWPRFVTVRRVWPSGLQISVEKAMVVARWNHAYLTADGRVVEMPSDLEGLPVLNCATSEPKAALETYLRLNIIAADAGLALAALEENELGEWMLKFPDGVTLMLGSERLSERFERFVIVYRQALQARFDQVARVDARYASGLAVSWVNSVAAADGITTPLGKSSQHGI